MKALKFDKKIMLKNLSPGTLFMWNTTIALKSEYKTEDGAIECIIVGTGEMFWGGAKSKEELAALEVTKIKIIEI